MPEALLYEYFDALLVGYGAPGWPYAARGVIGEWTPGQDGLIIPAGGGGAPNGVLQGGARMFLTASSRFFFELVDIDAANISLLAGMSDPLLAHAPFIEFQVVVNQLRGSAIDQTGASHAATSVAYSAAAMRYLGWLWDGTNLHLQYSADATTWVDFLSVANMATVHQEMIFALTCANLGGANPAFVTVPAINLPTTSNNATKMAAMAVAQSMTALLQGAGYDPGSGGSGTLVRILSDVERSFA